MRRPCFIRTINQTKWKALTTINSEIRGASVMRAWFHSENYGEL